MMFRSNLIIVSKRILLNFIIDSISVAYNGGKQMKHNEKKVSTDVNVKNILEEYIRLGSVKSIRKLARQNSYRIRIKGTENPEIVNKIRRHLQKHGYHTRISSNYRTRSIRYQGKHYINVCCHSDRYIIAKVGAPPPPKNPDDFGEIRSRKTSKNRNRG